MERQFKKGNNEVAPRISDKLQQRIEVKRSDGFDGDESEARWMDL